MTGRAITVTLVGAFWLAHFAASLLALSLFLVLPLHPEDFSNAEVIAAQVVLFPVVLFITKWTFAIPAAAVNSGIWGLGIYALIVLLRRRLGFLRGRN